MKVLVHDPFAGDVAAQYPWAAPATGLDDLLERSDFVTLHTSLTPETAHLIGERELGLMRSSAYLINVSRGPVVDEPALIRALEDGQLAGAGLDVFKTGAARGDQPVDRDVQRGPHPAHRLNTLEGVARMSNAVVDESSCS